MAAKPHAALRKKLLAYALSLPGAEEHHPWGENVAKAGGKIFFGGRPENDFLAGLKLPLSRSAALRLLGAEPVGYGMGAYDWVTLWGAGRISPGRRLLRVWIRESYGAVAPERLSAQLTGAAPDKGPARRVAASSARTTAAGRKRDAPRKVRG